jgi:hypothetical protein
MRPGGTSRSGQDESAIVQLDEVAEPLCARLGADHYEDGRGGHLFALAAYGDTRTHYGPASLASAQIPRLLRTNPQVRKLPTAKLRDADKSRVTAAIIAPWPSPESW